MNILHTECSLNWGGQEYRTLLEHLYLNTHGHQSWLMCHPQSKLYQKAVEAQAPNLVKIDLSCAWRLDTALRIYVFCRRHKITIINSHGSRDSTLCLPSMLLNIALIRSRQIINPIKKAFSYQKACTHVIASAEKIKETMIAAGVSKDKITVISEGIDLTTYRPQQEIGYLYDEFKLDGETSVIINIGMIREDKGQRYFLEAARILLKKHPKLKFLLIGESGEDRQLENELREKISTYALGDHFILTGYREDIPALMNLADLVVISSIAEAQSRIAPQAFATGKTVVATNIGGLPELVKDGETGLLVPAKDAFALATAIATLLQNPDLKAELARRAYQFAQDNLAFSAMMTKILRTYAMFASM